jgi:Fe-S cluster assembly ATP-binding protein
VSERRIQGKVLLNIQDLSAQIGECPILKGISLTVREGEVHAIMGPNGSGKSTLSKVLAGHPSYEITGGTVEFKGKNLLSMAPDERSRDGLFLAFQYPQEISGVTISNFLRTALNARRQEPISAVDFRKLLQLKMDLLGMDKGFASRFVNDGFSGGEKKRNEVLQLAVLEPSLAVLDETDSGLDIDALRIVSSGVNAIREERCGAPAVILITHYNRILDYIKPDFVHVLSDGRIISSGGPSLARELEEKGYDWILQKGDQQKSGQQESDQGCSFISAKASSL